MTDPDKTAQLEELIRVSRDGELGYRTAAEHVGNSQLRTIFTQYAEQRAGFVRALSAEVIRLGGTPPESGTLGAAVHRGWIDVKSALSGGGAAAIVAACETGEDAAKAAFERVVNTDTSGEARTLAESQLRKVTEAHQHMLRLKEQMAGGTEFPHDA